MRVAVVGAGISGLTCAGRLANAGFEVLVLEKSRGPSGRMATRRAEPQLQFDHGAQYFTVRDPRFERVVQRWIAAGVAAQWDAKIAAITNGQLQWKSNQYSASLNRFSLNRFSEATGGHATHECHWPPP